MENLISDAEGIHSKQGLKLGEEFMEGGRGLFRNIMNIGEDKST